MSRPSPRWTCFSLAATLLVSSGVFAHDKEQGKNKRGEPEGRSLTSAARDSQRAPGVIVKAQALAKGMKSRADSDAAKNEKGQSPTHRLTINTAAVWRDWVRDQASTNNPTDSTREQANRGANSIATKGEPQSGDTLIVVDVGPETKLETRFRASTDETSKGAKTPAEALAANEDPAEAKGKGKAKGKRKGGETSNDSKITRFQADDLQPGLFVEVDYEHQDGRNLARTIAVIRPVGGPDDAPAGSSTSTSEPKTKK